MLKPCNTNLKLIIILLTSILFFISGAVLADEVTDSIDEAIEYYREGDFVEAANSLDYASQPIRQKRSGSLETFLPDPLTGWSAKDVEFSSCGWGIPWWYDFSKKSVSQGTKSNNNRNFY